MWIMKNISVCTLLGFGEHGEWSSEYAPMKVTDWSPPCICSYLFEVEYEGETFYVRQNLPINWNKDYDNGEFLPEEVTNADVLRELRGYIWTVCKNQPVQRCQRGIFSLKPDLVTLLEPDRQETDSDEGFDLGDHWEQIEVTLRHRRSYR